MAAFDFANYLMPFNEGGNKQMYIKAYGMGKVRCAAL